MHPWRATPTPPGVLLALLALLLAACGGVASPSATASGAIQPSSAATPSADPSAVPTPAPATYEPDSILLQFDARPDAVVDPYGDTIEEGIGGNLWYVPGPDFTLYGDGTVIFRDDEAARANTGREGRSFIPPPLSIGRLSPAQVQELLDFAWTDGGLAEADAHYPTVAQDLFISASFEISAGERRRHVQLDGLFPDPSGPDAEVRERLVALADHLRHLDQRMDVAVQPWVPERYWGALQEVDTSFVGTPASEWPWPHIQLEGWLGGRRSLLPSEVAGLGIGQVPGGFCCHLMSGPGGDDPPYTGYGLSITPLLPGPIATGTVAEVVTTDLVVRTSPGTDAATSQILQPTLAAPQLLYVVDGPVAADGYDWYLVQPFAQDHLPHPPVPSGWLAAAGKDGEPWIAPASLYCPPASLDAVSRMSGLARLVCFGNQPLTLEGTFGGCFVADPATVSPAWLTQTGCSLNPDGYSEDVTPGTGWLVLRGYEGVTGEEFGTRVRVEGHFDDPAAQTCTSVPLQGSPDPLPQLVVLGCRTQFVVTRVQPAG